MQDFLNIIWIIHHSEDDLKHPVIWTIKRLFTKKNKIKMNI